MKGLSSVGRVNDMHHPGLNHPGLNPDLFTPTTTPGGVPPAHVDGIPIPLFNVPTPASPPVGRTPSSPPPLHTPFKTQYYPTTPSFRDTAISE